MPFLAHHANAAGDPHLLHDHLREEVGRGLKLPDRRIVPFP